MNESSSRAKPVTTVLSPILTLLIAACASSTPNVPPRAASPVPLSRLSARVEKAQDSGFEKIWASQDDRLLQERLDLKITQIQTGFIFGRQALQEFDQALEQGRDAGFLKQVSENGALSRILGADVYRSIAEDGLLSFVIGLELACASDVARATQSTVVTPVKLANATLANPAANPEPAPSLGHCQEARAQKTLNWIAARISRAPESGNTTAGELARLAFLPFAEKLLAQTGPSELTLLLTSALIRDQDKLLELERSPSLRREISREGLKLRWAADRELKNWVLHFAKSSAAISDESQYAPHLVGRKHSLGLRQPASGTPPARDVIPATPALAHGVLPLRPFSARELNDNEFVLIFEGPVQNLPIANLATELATQNRPATFFLAGHDLSLARDDGADWLNAISNRKNLTFATAGETSVPISLETDGELAQSVERGRAAMNLSHLASTPFFKPCFEAESGRLSKIAHERGLRLVRANIESFDQIDFDPRRVASRIVGQTSLLKSGIIRMQMGSPRASAIQRELTVRLDADFKRTHLAPRFTALAAHEGSGT